MVHIRYASNFNHGDLKMAAKENPYRQQLLDEIATLQREFDILDVVEDMLSGYTSDAVTNLCRAGDELDAAKAKLAEFDNAHKERARETDQ